MRTGSVRIKHRSIRAHTDRYAHAHPQTLILDAAAAGATRLLRFLIREGVVPVNHQSSVGGTALHAAIHQLREGVALDLIETPGINVNLATAQGATPLMVAAKTRAWFVCVRWGAWMDGLGIGDREPRARGFGTDWRAHRHTHTTNLKQIGLLNIMKALVAKGTAVDAVDGEGKSALDHAVETRAEAAALYLVEKAGAAWGSLALHAPDGNTPDSAVLWQACAADMCGVVLVILKRLRAMVAAAADSGAAAEAVRELVGSVAQASIVHKGKLPILKALLEAGLVDGPRMMIPVLYRRMASQITLFHCAASAGNREAASLLLEHGADPRLRPDGGILPHHMAAAIGRLPFLIWLLADVAPIDVDETADGGPAGLTMLQLAAMGGHMGVVEWLVVEKGADVTRTCTYPSSSPSRKGLSVRACTLAEEKGYTEVAAFLRGQEEAALRRARNEKRRQNQKNANARRQQAAAGKEAAVGGGADEDGDSVVVEGLAVAMAGLGVAGSVVDGG